MDLNSATCLPGVVSVGYIGRVPWGAKTLLPGCSYMVPVGNERSSLTITSAFSISSASIHGGGGGQQYSIPRTSTSVPTASNQDDKKNKVNTNKRTNNSSSTKHKDDADAREKREVFENAMRRKLRENNVNSSDIEFNSELKRKVQKEMEKFLNKNLNLNTTGK